MFIQLISFTNNFNLSTKKPIADKEGDDDDDDNEERGRGQEENRISLCQIR